MSRYDVEKLSPAERAKADTESRIWAAEVSGLSSMIGKEVNDHPKNTTFLGIPESVASEEMQKVLKKIAELESAPMLDSHDDVRIIELKEEIGKKRKEIKNFVCINDEKHRHSHE